MTGPTGTPTSAPAPEPGSKLDRALQAAAGKPHVLVVEGADDRAFFDALFTHVAPTWPSQIAVVDAEGRGKALKWTQTGGPFAQAHCYVDRDVWTQSEVAQRQADHGRLLVTDGWCIENLVVMLAAQGHFGAGLLAKLAQDRDAWVRAGSFGWVWQRWQDEITVMVDIQPARGPRPLSPAPPAPGRPDGGPQARWRSHQGAQRRAGRGAAAEGGAPDPVARPCRSTGPAAQSRLMSKSIIGALPTLARLA